MEKWQRNYIKFNLPELVEITLCNTALLTRLYSEEVISNEELHEINVTQNPVEKARKLYEIVVTRKNAYRLLLEACKETRQTGVVSILEDGELTHKQFQSYKQQSTKTGQNSPRPSSVTNILPEISSYAPLNTIVQQNVSQNLTEFKENSSNKKPECSKKLTSSNACLASPDSHADKYSRNENFPKHDFSSDSNVNEIKPTEAGQRPSTKAEPNSNHFKQRTDQVPEVDSVISEINNDPTITLHQALKDGASLIIIKSLIDKGANYKIKNEKKEGVLHLAVRGGDKEVISFLLSLKMDINEKDELGETPLHEARFTKSRNFLEMTKFLLDNGANIRAQDKKGRTIAHLFSLPETMSSEDFQSWVKGMVDCGHCNIFAFTSKIGMKPLHFAMERFDLDMSTIKLMLEHSNMDINKQLNDGSTILHQALNFGRTMETIKNLIQLGANIKIKDKNGCGALHNAVCGGNLEVIQYLLAAGLDINEKDTNGFTPLHYVSGTRLQDNKNFFEVTKLLLENGADLYSKAENGNTLGHFMAISENVSCEDFKIWATALIENGHVKLFTIRGEYGRNYLFYLMQRPDLDLETIKLIIQSAKIDINQRDSQKNSVLHFALESGRHIDTIKSLLELGADWKKKGRFECSVLHSAVEGGNKEAFLFFKTLGEDVNARNEDGRRTPLHYVKYTKGKDYLGMTKVLLENGAILNAKDDKCKTLDQLMLVEVTSDEYSAWKEGLINMGYASFFGNKSTN